MEKRIVKFPLPVELIRRIDKAVVAGKGGLDTREQFFREAAEGFLAELSYEQAPEPVTGPEAETDPEVVATALHSVPAWEREELQLKDLAGTALRAPEAGTVWDSGVSEPDQEPILGLHNRDYPSLWAAARLSRYTENGAIPFDEFRARATKAAWMFGVQLAGLPNAGGARLTALFPTNPSKAESSERAFQNFAIGSVPRRRSEEGQIRASGPLFVWRLCELRWMEGALFVAMRPEGRELLSALAGLSLSLPHDREFAEVFLNHILTNAPGDSWGFRQLVDTVGAEPRREEIVSAVAIARPEWTLATASSIAQGYIARAREWGLLEPRLQEGKYHLTEFGEEWRSDSRTSQPTSHRGRDE
ncbi:MAG TPA: hypothetical protein VGI73_02725 [Solirubrobacterales bacterium]|jgi:hypothetical protein